MSNLDPTIEKLKERGWREVRAIDQALDSGEIDVDGWHEAMATLLKHSYLTTDNPYAQAGHSGDAATWEASRGFIAQAIDRSGTFLDVGCASGILMESVVRWAMAKGHRIEPYGLDIVPEFVELARKRLPHWADRIYLGNIRTWQPENQRFDFALIRPEYAPRNLRADMVEHVLKHVLKPDGRLIVFVGTEEKGAKNAELSITHRGLVVHGHVDVVHEKDPRVVRRLFWIDNPGRLDRYEPIDCGFHDQLLEKATLRVPTKITYLDDDNRIQIVKDVIEDVFARQGAEYLRFRGGIEIRLDKIRALDASDP